MSPERVFVKVCRKPSLYRQSRAPCHAPIVRRGFAVLAISETPAFVDELMGFMTGEMHVEGL